MTEKTAKMLSLQDLQLMSSIFSKVRKSPVSDRCYLEVFFERRKRISDAIANFENAVYDNMAKTEDERNNEKCMSPDERNAFRKEKFKNAMENARNAVIMAESELKTLHNDLTKLLSKKGRSKSPLKEQIASLKKDIAKLVKRLDELQDIALDAETFYLAYTSESWDICKNMIVHDNAYIGDFRHGKAFLNLCEIIAYTAIKSRVISISASLAHSKRLKDGKNHRKAFYERACNAGCDKKMLQILKEFSFAEKGERAQDITSAVYTNLVDAYLQTEGNEKARSVPMFIIGMRYAWKAIEKEKSARVKIGTNKEGKSIRQYVYFCDYDAEGYDGRHKLHELIPCETSNIGYSRSNAIIRTVEKKAESNLFVERIEGFISESGGYLKPLQRKLLEAMHEGISIAEYARAESKSKAYYSKVLSDIQKALQKVDASESCKNHREATFLDFVDFYSHTNRYC